jgi:serine/threonine-protein kinase
MEQFGPYRLHEKLGEGAMGVVYVGEHAETGERAALKVLPSGGNEGFRARFEGEIETLRQLRHQNIVQLYGFGEQEGRLFYAMELVEGRNLEQRRLDETTIPWREVLDIGIQVANALRHAHDRGVIHRDLKPANLIEQSDGTIKVADFGVARLWGQIGRTREGGLIGTPNYMSPEQAEGRPAQERSDLYSVGCVLYALLSGSPPFLADTAAQMLQLQSNVEPDSLAAHAPHVPPYLAWIVDRLLRKAPAQRIGSAQALARRLAEARHEETCEPEDKDRGEEPEPEGETNGATKPGAGPRQTAPGEQATVASEGGEGSTPEAARQSNSVPIRAESATEAVEARPGAEEEANPLAEETPAEGGAGASFVTVEEAEQGARRVAERSAAAEGRRLASVLSSLGTFLVLLALVAGGWWLLQPPGADALYQRIEKRMEGASLEEATKAASAVDRFLERFPEDPRAEQVRRYRERIELARLHKRLALQARTDGIDPKLSPPARTYVRALRIMDRDPAGARARFAALAALFGPAEEASGMARNCVQLAERQQERLEDKAETYVRNQHRALRLRLKRARKLAKENPEAARRMCAALLRLYEGQAWAQPLRAEARRLRARLPAPATSTAPAE